MVVRDPFTMIVLLFPYRSLPIQASFPWALGSRTESPWCSARKQTQGGQSQSEKSTSRLWRRRWAARARQLREQSSVRRFALFSNAASKGPVRGVAQLHAAPDRTSCACGRGLFFLLEIFERNRRAWPDLAWPRNWLYCSSILKSNFSSHQSYTRWVVLLDMWRVS